MGSATPARILAPISLVAAVVAVVIVVQSSTSSNGDDVAKTSSSRTTTASTRTATTGTTARPAAPKTYTVKAGDGLSTVSEKTGVSVERLLELNPELDPNALQVGQKIKLGE